jgi:PadR family transcriptional regulator, regulatory protein PadR
MKFESSRESAKSTSPSVTKSHTPLDNLVKLRIPLDNQEEKLRTMPPKPSDLIQGTLEMLILKTLALEPMHGYGIALRIEQISNGIFRVNPGSLFPALTRLERAGRIKPEWRATENNRRAKYYLLTDRGRKALKEETQQWGRQLAAITSILEA